MMRSSTFACALLLTAAAWAQDATVQQQVVGVSPARGERLYQALTVEGRALYEFRERVGDAYDDVKMGIRWTVTSSEHLPRRGWMIRGRLGVVFLSNPTFDTVCWLGEEYGGPAGGDLACVYTAPLRGPLVAEKKFVYDKPVLITYREAGGRLSLTLLEAEEEAGTFNLAATAVAEEAHAFNLGLSVRQLSLGVSASNHEYTVVASGLPYVVRPVLRVQPLPGDYLTVSFGLRWESRMTINAPTLGLESHSDGAAQLEFSWGNRPAVGLEATGGTTRSEFDSSMMIKTEGEGLTAVLRYDETLAHRAYELVGKADHKWVMQVHNIAFLRAGSIQEERAVEIGRRTEGTWKRREVPWLPSWIPGHEPPPPGSRSLPRGGLGADALEMGRWHALELGLQVLRPQGLVDDEQRWDAVQQMYLGAAPKPAAGISDSEAFQREE